jgi:hypothetical protein
MVAACSCKAAAAGERGAASGSRRSSRESATAHACTTKLRPAATETGATATTEAGATAPAEMGTTAATAHMGTTAATAAANALREARRRQRENQCHCRDGAQNFQTCHDRTPFPKTQPDEGALVPAITPLCV